MEKIEKIEAVREAALKMLNRRDMTVSELRKKLLERDYEVHHADIVIKSLQKSGLLDDVRYAEIFIRSKLESGRGYAWIKNKLTMKGIPADEINAAAEAVKASEDMESERIICLRKALTLMGMSAYFEIDGDGIPVPAEDSPYTDEAADVFGERAAKKVKAAGLKPDKRSLCKEREKVRASLMRRLASAGFPADAVLNAVRAIEKL